MTRNTVWQIATEVWLARILAGFLFQPWARRALNLTEETVFEENVLVLASCGLLCPLRLGTIKPIEKEVDCKSPLRVILRLIHEASDTAAVQHLGCQN